MTAPASELHITALLACHNRRDITLRCLRSLFATQVKGLRLDAVLVDDGSTDGTADAVRALGVPVVIVPGPGNWFWPRSMAEAERAAERADPDALLWLNDDVELVATALLEIVLALRQRPATVLVGGLVERARPKLTYSGFNWADDGADMVRRVRPDGSYQTVEGFHGNVVVVPRSVRCRVGGIDGSWPHNFGDLDYARRLNSAGVPIVLLPNVVGTCNGHTVAYLDPQRRPVQRLWAALGRKGWPLAANWRYHRRHGLALRGGRFTSTYRRAWRGRPGAATQTGDTGA
jgi:GT2 family glycosyltransferase